MLLFSTGEYELMKNEEHVVIFINANTDKEAQDVAKALLNNKLAACVNIVPKISSLFWWNNKLDSAKERLLIVKSKTFLLHEIVRLVKDVHSYEIPEIIALPIVGGNPDYLNWISKEVKQDTTG
jgi:periplasmic divalent cation tolerance protein